MILAEMLSIHYRAFMLTLKALHTAHPEWLILAYEDLVVNPVRFWSYIAGRIGLDPESLDAQLGYMQSRQVGSSLANHKQWGRFFQKLKYMKH